jgi:DICT domain-containing protein
MIQNITRREPPTAEEIQAREPWLAEQRAAADAVNAQFMLAKQQQDAAEFQSRLVEATQLSLEQLGGIREWLKHNP